MNERELKKLLEDKAFLEQRITFYKRKNNKIYKFHYIGMIIPINWN